MKASLAGLAILAFALGAGALGEAEPLARLVPGLGAEELERLSAGKSLCRDASSGLALAPDCPEGARLRAELAAEAAPVRIESAYLFRGRRLEPGRKLALYNALTAVRSLSGLLYFSFTRNRETVLLDEVYRTDAPGSHRRLPDAASSSLPELSSLELHARDANFGSTWYRLSVDSRGPGLFLSLVNTEPQSRFLFQAFERGALRLRYIVASADEGIYIYGVCAASPAAGASAMVDIFSAAQKRLEAIRGWVAGRIETL